MISQEEYQARRNKLSAQVPAHSIIFVSGAPEIYRNGDTHYRFRQDSNFYYLTGFNEPESVLVITTGHNSQSILFNRSRNPAQEQWTGKRLGQEGAVTDLHMDLAFSISDLAQELPHLLQDKEKIYYSFGQGLSLEQDIGRALAAVKAQVRKGVCAPHSLNDLEPILSEMRLFKSEAELSLMRKAAEISVDAHKKAMKACAYAKNEVELEAELIYEFTRRGCRSVAYDSIVAGGENACILHYTENNKPLKQGELVLIDAGGEYQSYAADITRTFPISGQFTQEQAAIYDLVLNAQQAGISAIKPGLAWNQIQVIMISILTQGLCELGILHGSVDELIATEAYKPFYMHNSGHWLGLDVHDVGRYKIKGAWRSLEAGMVLTVEPGLYISKDLPKVDKCWWGIGVRIEDDVLVTSSGSEVLTAGLPVERAEIEALMRG